MLILRASLTMWVYCTWKDSYKDHWGLFTHHTHLIQQPLHPLSHQHCEWFFLYIPWILHHPTIWQKVQRHSCHHHTCCLPMLTWPSQTPHPIWLDTTAHHTLHSCIRHFMQYFQCYTSNSLHSYNPLLVYSLSCTHLKLYLHFMLSYVLHRGPGETVFHCNVNKWFKEMTIIRLDSDFHSMH